MASERVRLGSVTFLHCIPTGEIGATLTSDRVRSHCSAREGRNSRQCYICRLSRANDQDSNLARSIKSNSHGLGRIFKIMHHLSIVLCRLTAQYRTVSSGLSRSSQPLDGSDSPSRGLVIQPTSTVGSASRTPCLPPSRPRTDSQGGASMRLIEEGPYVDSSWTLPQRAQYPHHSVRIRHGTGAAVDRKRHDGCEIMRARKLQKYTSFRGHASSASRSAPGNAPVKQFLFCDKGPERTHAVASRPTRHARSTMHELHRKRDRRNRRRRLPASSVSN
ncbi:hypothetical protein KC337_g119 [Hortaea werneckii]|nr:hypothetical protein KC337_g119 [Hortaea werneckii]